MTPHRATFDVGGKGHWLLRKVSARPTSREDLLTDAVTDLPKGHKIKFVAGTLQRAGWIVFEDKVYAITADGRMALARLDAGFVVEVGAGTPNGRVFASRQAA